LRASWSARDFAVSSIDLPGRLQGKRDVRSVRRRDDSRDVEREFGHRIASPPSNGSFQTCDEPERVEMK